MAAARAGHREVVGGVIRLDDWDATEDHEDYGETVDAEEDGPHGEKNGDDEGDTLLLVADRSLRHNIESLQKGGVLAGVRVLEGTPLLRTSGAVQDFPSVVAAGEADNFPVRRKAAE